MPTDTLAGETSRPTLSQQVATAVIVFLPLTAFVLAIVKWHTLSPLSALVQVPVLYFLTVIGITVSFHRELTHRALTLRPGARYFFAILGSLSVEGGVFSWCALHRKHHQFTDRKGDPHSPHGHGEGVLAVVRGFMHAHCGWFFHESEPSYKKYIPDLMRDEGLVLIDKLFPLWIVVSFALPGFITLAFTHTLRGFIAGAIWGGAVRILFVHHVTWSINSVCHLWGTRPFVTKDKSTNNFFFGYTGGGEGWHHNHHVFPQSARIGLRWWEFDLGWQVIRFLQVLGFVEEVNVPTREQIEAKLPRSAA